MVTKSVVLVDFRTFGGGGDPGGGFQRLRRPDLHSGFLHEKIV